MQCSALIQNVIMSNSERPSLLRWPYNRYETTASLCIIAVAVVATIFVVYEKSDKEVPMLTLKGKVLNPDGTPARQGAVHFTNITTNPPQAVCCAPPSESGTATAERLTISTDMEGNFEFPQIVPAGTTVLFLANSTLLPHILVSEPMIFLAEKDRDNITLQLQEGIRVEGTAMLEDGTPGAADTVMAFRIMTPKSLPGSEQMKADELRATMGAMQAAAIPFQATVQDDGTFEIYLPPGDFSIMGTGGTYPVPVSIDRDGGEKYHVDLIYFERYGKFVTEDGSVPGKLRTFHIFNDGRSCNTPIPVLPDGRYSLWKKEKGSVLFAITEDGFFGIVHPIPDDELEEFQTAVLQPTATATLRLHDSAGQPLVGRRISVGASSGGDVVFGFFPPVTTDVDSMATIKLPPGTAYYRLSWDEAGNLVGEESMGFTRTLQSGETIDLGTVEVTK